MLLKNMKLDVLEEYIKTKDYINVQKEAFRIVKEDDWCESLKDVIHLIHHHECEQKMIETVLQHWDDMFDTTNVILKVIRDYIAPRDSICYLLTQLDFMEDLPYLLERAVELKKNGNYDIFARNIISYFTEADCMGLLPKDKPLTVGQAEFILHNVKEYQDRSRVDCSDVIRFFDYYIGGIKQGEIPSWVSLNEGENLSLLQTVSPGLPHEERKVLGDKYITQAKDLFASITKEGNVKGKKVPVNMKKAFESFLSVISEQNSKDLHNPNRVFGPLNAFKDRNCVSSPGKEGPCRMLECRCRNKDGSEWFFGRCEQCSIGIRDRSHALRIPTKEGGWVGCICSFECMEKSLPFHDNEINIKIEAMKHALKTDGIMDRNVL